MYDTTRQTNSKLSQTMRPRHPRWTEYMNARWTAEQIPDQQGRTAIVTGANSGLGFIVARELAGAGAHVIIASRDAGRGAGAMGLIKASHPAANIEVGQLDLASLGSV